MKKYKVGYTQGVYDMFHTGHLNLINHAKEQCDYLIVGVNADSLVEEYKHKTPVINEKDRRFIVENIKAVDEAIIVYTLDKVKIWQEKHFDAIFIGDDWRGNERWAATGVELAKVGVDLIYLPYTKDVSSTMLREEQNKRIAE